jgi:hypothetical protein
MFCRARFCEHTDRRLLFAPEFSFASRHAYISYRCTGRAHAIGNSVLSLLDQCTDTDVLFFTCFPDANRIELTATTYEMRIKLFASKSVPDCVYVDCESRGDELEACKKWLSVGQHLERSGFRPQLMSDTELLFRN